MALETDIYTLAKALDAYVLFGNVATQSVNKLIN